MSKELIERINELNEASIRTPWGMMAFSIITDCQKQITELEQRIATMQSDINGWLVIKGNMLKREEELEQENSRWCKEVAQHVHYAKEMLIVQGGLKAQLESGHQLMTDREQENSRLKGRIEAEVQSGMQSLRTQENLFGAKLDALQAQLEAAEGVLREYSSIDDPGHLDRRWISKRAADYFRTKEGKEKA